MREKFKIYQNYIIIAILSLISVFFLPMLGSEAGVGLKLPNTSAGWIVYILTKLCIIVINMLLLDQFVKQSKVNVRDNEHFIAADEYFNTKEVYEKLLTPKEFIGGIYKRKMLTTTICSILGVFGFTQAILVFDWVSMLTYMFTIVFGLIFGWITMNECEIYWTETYYKLYLKEKEKKDAEISGERIQELRGTSSKE